ncbi:MAG TPA: peptidyl-prolyl cis-trans isomerase, partial [Opitutaceae bacterium]|nr:peptidyl-prolyl cis-trans isomerase [Opitutaceae bacterium]
MISWIQRNFQHHFRTIFGVLLAVIIISFIFTIGATPGIGRGDHRVIAQPFFGYNLGSPDDQHHIFGDAELSVFLQYGVPIGASPQLQEFAFQRTAALALADQLHLPDPSSDTLASYVKTLGGFANANGEFDPNRYGTFFDKQLWSKLDPLFTVNDVSRVIADNWRIDQVKKLLSGPGYVLPGDIKTQLTHDETQWTISVASADYSKYSPAITPTPAEITNFFNENPAGYKIPARINVSYIAFPTADFVPQVSVTADEVRAYYDANPARFPKPASNKAPADLAKLTPVDNFPA